MSRTTRTVLTAIALATAAMAASPAFARQTGPAAPRVAERVESTNADVVTRFYDLAFNQHKPTEAARLYIGDHYIQHNPGVPNGAEPFTSYFEGYFRENPQNRATIHRVIAQGDLVALHVHMQASPEDAGQAIIDIFRVENGKIVEHWDVIQPVPETTANGNTMFQGSKAD